MSGAVFTLIVYPPSDDLAKMDFARHVADLHADLVIRHIERLNCSAESKVTLVDRVIREVRNEKSAGGASEG